MKELNAGQGKMPYSGKGQPIGFENKQSKTTKKLSGGKKHPVQKI
jgi:hypothetical protein